MYLISALSFACLAAVTLASAIPFDFEAELQEARILAGEVSPYVDDVTAAIPAFLTAAQALYDAADVLDRLDDKTRQLDGLRDGVRNAEVGGPEDRDERRATSGAILDMIGAVSSVRIQYEHLLLRTNRIIDFVRQLDTSIREQQDTLLGRSGPIRCRSDQVGDNYYDTDVGCYYLETTRMNWQDARQACIDRGMDLVSITSREEQDVLDALYETRRQDFHYHWTSGTLTSTPENSRLWVWAALNDEPLDFDDWNSGQPNYLSGDNTIIGSCRQVNGQQTTWCDYGSHNSETSLCEQY